MWTRLSGSGCQRRSGSRPVSRVLSWAIIHLGPPSPVASCDLPESAAGHGIAFLFGLAPGGVYLATACYHVCGALLPHHFTLTDPGLSTRTGGIFSVALSVDSRPPGVTWHPALWSPDFPPHRVMERLPGRLPDLLSHKAPGRKLCFFVLFHQAIEFAARNTADPGGHACGLAHGKVLL